VLVGDEAGGVVLVAGADRDHLGASGPDLVVALTQLRGMLPAEQSAEMAQEDHDHRPLGPEIAQPVGCAGGVGELEVGEPAHVHERAI
jgi:hypothetical protein